MSPRHSHRKSHRSGDGPRTVDYESAANDRAGSAATASSGEELWFRTVFDAVDQFIGIVASDGTVIDANLTALRLGGVRHADVVGRRLWLAPWWQLDRDTRERVRKAIRSAAEGERARFEQAIVDPGGRATTLEFSLHLMAEEGISGGLMILEGHDVTRRSKADAAIRRSEARLSAIVMNAMEAIVVVDAEQNIVMFNEAAEWVFRCQAADVLGTSLDRFIPEDARSAHRDHVRRFGESGELNRPMAHRGTLWGQRATGEIFPMEASISQAGEGADKLYTVILNDISERHRAEEALKDSEERLRMVVKATNEVIWEWKIATSELVWSEEAWRAFRYAPEEMGTSIDWWYDRIHPLDREEVISGLNALLGGTGDVWSDEYRFLRGDGSYACVLDRGYVRRDARGVPLMAIGAMLDVTERRRSEEAQRFLSQASAILDSSLDPEVVLPDVARLLIPAYADLCRIDLLEEDGSSRRAAAAHVMPAKISLLMGGERLATDSEAHASPLAHAIRSGEAVLMSAPPGQDLERLGKHKPFREYWERLGVRSLLAVPLIAHERVLGSLTMAMAESDRQYGPMDLMLATDLGRRIGIVLENAGHYADAQRAIRAREEILNVVSHDLRVPLSTICNAVELLQEQAGPESGSQRWLAMIARSTDRMNGMIGDLLDAARIGLGGFAIKPARYELGRLLAEVRESFAPQAETDGLELHCDAVSDVTIVWIDTRQIHRVLSNLINNAMKFTPRGGSISVTVDRCGEDARFAVADTGRGIATDQLPHLFSPYWQADRKDRRGLGLGLTIAQGIVAAHGGRIWAESEEGRGTTFYFTVPLAEPPAGSTRGAV
ncbi:MAG TPA: PAS domain S-box protein [Longimicrobiales bacterium]